MAELLRDVSPETRTRLRLAGADKRSAFLESFLMLTPMIRELTSD